MNVITRPAVPTDAPAMCEVLNPIIDEGSTTGHRTPFDVARMYRHYIGAAVSICCTVVELDGEVVGFQSLTWPRPEYDPFPEGWAIIATFVKPGLQGRGIGQALWNDTQAAAKEAGVRIIDATIRTDNIPGLAYYSGLGFRDYSSVKVVGLSDGTSVDKTQKRFDIT